MTDAGVAELGRLAVLAAFVVLGARVARSGPGPGRRRRVQALLAYTLGMQALVVLVQRDAWPFSHHPIAADRAGAGPHARIELRALDAAGREHRVHPQSWSPLSQQTLQLWFARAYPGLDEGGRCRALGFLLERAEAARERLAAGRRIGHQRILGPAAAPDWVALYAVPDGATPGPFVGLRVYEVRWTPAEKRLDRGREARSLLGEVRKR